MIEGISSTYGTSKKPLKELMELLHTQGHKDEAEFAELSIRTLQERAFLFNPLKCNISINIIHLQIFTTD